MVGRRTLLLIVAGLLLLPGASADLRVAVTGVPTEPIEPFSGSAQVEVRISADCVDVLAALDPTNPTAAPVVTLNITAAPGVIIAGATTAQLSPDPCRSGATNVTASRPQAISITKDAPALVPLTVAVEAELRPRLGDPQTADAAFDVTAAPFFLFDLQVAKSIAVAKNGKAAFEVQAINHGNTAIEVVWERIGGGPELLEAPSVSLDAPGGAYASRNVTLVVAEPTDTEATVSLRAIPQLPGNQTHGQELVVNLLVREERSFLDQATPAPGTLPALLATLAVAFVLRRRA